VELSKEHADLNDNMRSRMARQIATQALNEDNDLKRTSGGATKKQKSGCRRSAYCTSCRVTCPEGWFPHKNSAGHKQALEKKHGSGDKVTAKTPSKLEPKKASEKTEGD